MNNSFIFISGRSALRHLFSAFPLLVCYYQLKLWFLDLVQVDRRWLRRRALLIDLSDNLFGWYLWRRFNYLSWSALWELWLNKRGQRFWLGVWDWFLAGILLEWFLAVIWFYRLSVTMEGLPASLLIRLFSIAHTPLARLPAINLLFLLHITNDKLTLGLILAFRL